ncbi:UPF0147 family protein [Thermoproteota archaeon]
MADERIQNIIEALQDLVSDNTVPKNVKSKLETVMHTLKTDGDDISIRINKALSELDEVSDDTNIQSYTRTQIWNIASMLEMFN